MEKINMCNSQILPNPRGPCNCQFHLGHRGRHFAPVALALKPAVAALFGALLGGAPAPRLNGVRRCVPVALQPFTQGKIT